jgi:hypothetical protein
MVAVKTEGAITGRGELAGKRESGEPESEHEAGERVLLDHPSTTGFDYPCVSSPADC